MFPNGFPPELIAAVENEAGTKSMGNVCISGTEAIRIYGEEHLKTGYPIVYTSADSVFQVAAHEDKLPIDRLYRVCRAARKVLTGDWGVARVIARPFAGKPGSFKRTARRKDFSLDPPGQTLLDVCKAAEQEVSLIGKLDDLFAQRGFTRTFHSVNNMESFDRTLVEIRRVFPGLLFTNLIQFDMDWGHRNDVKAYYQGLQEFDRRLPEALSLLRDDDVLFITSTTVMTRPRRQPTIRGNTCRCWFSASRCGPGLIWGRARVSRTWDKPRRSTSGCQGWRTGRAF